MYKRKTRLAARLLSIVLAAGMSVSGVSVSALAAQRNLRLHLRLRKRTKR